MTQQDVFDMAREVCGKWPRFMSNPNLQAFAKLVAAKERERIIAENKPEIEKCNAYIKELETKLYAIKARGEA